jgi:exodeoxyribonuclease VII small subunit
MTFESAMKELETIVHELESGNLSLDETIKKFEKGIHLSSYCTKMLDDAEKKITVLVEKTDGSYNEENFNIDEVD